MDFIFDPGLVLYLPLYKLDGSSFMSKDAYGHLCTVTGALWRPDGRWFDKLDDIIPIADASSLRLQPPYTIEFWVYRNSLYDSNNTKREYLVAKGGTEKYGYMVNWEMNTGRLRSITGTGTSWIYDFSSKASWAIGWWHIGVVVGSDRKDTFYVQGVQDVARNTVHNTIQHEAVNVNLGYTTTDMANSIAIDCKLGEIRFYNRALTPLEIHHNYLATKRRYR